jgi:hypothetical protein
VRDELDRNFQRLNSLNQMLCAGIDPCSSERLYLTAQIDMQLATLQSLDRAIWRANGGVEEAAVQVQDRKIPGNNLARILRAFLTSRAFRQHVLIAIAEMQAEWAEEMARGRSSQARWVIVRGYAIIGWAFIGALLPRFIRRLL